METSRRLKETHFWRVEERKRKSERKVPKAAGVRDCFEGVKPISWKSSFAGGRIILSRLTKLDSFEIVVLG